MPEGAPKERSFCHKTIAAKDWCGVAVNECHEMRVNKDCKLAIVRPSKERMSHIANYFGFRSKMVNNLKAQMLPQDEDDGTECYLSTSRSRKSDENVKFMFGALQSHHMNKPDTMQQPVHAN